VPILFRMARAPHMWCCFFSRSLLFTVMLGCFSMETQTLLRADCADVCTHTPR
jgi:hypothetical protein